MNPTETAEMLEIIRDAEGRRLTILLIEHKLDLVMQLSDRVVVMDDGAQDRRRPAARGRRRSRGDRGLSRSRRRGRRACAGGGGMTAHSRHRPTPILELDRVNTFYGPIQVHFDLRSRSGAARSSACSAATPAASRRR